MKKSIIKIIPCVLISFLMMNTSVLAMHPYSQSEISSIIENEMNDNQKTILNEDFDPLQNIILSVHINKIRAFDQIDKHSEPDFFVKVKINEETFTSPVWKNQKVLKNIDWSVSCDVPDNEEFVEINIQLWDWNPGLNTLCDIATNDNQDPKRKDLTFYYSIKTGHWIGDDMVYIPHSWSMDLSGYGRGNGCDDNSIYQKDKDCEIYFDITQNDYDQDTIPYWTEVNIYNTNPKVDDRGRDDDKDNIPIEWEHKWGHMFDYDYNEETNEYEIVHDWLYHPFIFNNHSVLDPDGDGITNVEEYLTSEWNSDPFRKDIFVELDQMEEGPNGERASALSEESKELMKKAFNRQNILLHLDDGTWEHTGSDMIPFDPLTDGSWNVPNNELDQIYQQYFIQNAPDDWRFTVFHYGVVIYQSSVVNGNAFGANRFQISAKGVRQKARLPFPISGDKDVVMASAYMHELGHSLGLMWLGGHSRDAYYPWQPLWWKFRPYRSLMNYGYMYGSIWNLIDYSDGSRGKNDFDDWSNIDYYYFLQSFT
ncbi:MAG: hypothetical protein KGY65_07815 [Candidatus Thermoplasmatota archaeon]|nr:hypothetical protein [Candidatus Thermoplasmatota archaeon]